MRSYFASIRAFNKDIRLFLIYNLFANVGFGVFQLVYNLYLLKLNMREDDIGAFSAVQTVCMGFGGISLGFLVNRFGSWRCIAGGFTVFLLASGGIAFAEIRWQIYVLSAVYGVGLAFLFNTTMPFLLEWGERRQRALATAVSFSLISFSVTFGSLMGGLLPSAIDSVVSTIGDGSLEAYRWTMVLGTLVAALGFIPFALMTNARTNRAPVAETLVAEPTNATERKQVRLDMIVFILIGGLMSLGVGMVIPFYNVFLTTLGANERQVGFVFALGSAVAAVIGLSAPTVARRLGALDAVFYLRFAIVPLYLILIPFPFLGLAVVAHVIRQTTISVSWPIESTFIGEVLPPKARSSVYGLRSAAWNLCSALAAFIAGKIIVRTGYDWTFMSIAFFTGLSAIVFTLYYRRHPLVRDGVITTALRQAPTKRTAPIQ